MVRNIPTHVIADVRDLSKNSRNPVFAHLNLCPVVICTQLTKNTTKIANFIWYVFNSIIIYNKYIAV